MTPRHADYDFPHWQSSRFWPATEFGLRHRPFQCHRCSCFIVRCTESLKEAVPGSFLPIGQCTSLVKPGACSLVVGRNLRDLDFSLRCRHHVPLTLAHERPCKRGYVRKKPPLWIGLVFADDPKCLALSILTLDRHLHSESNHIGVLRRLNQFCRRTTH